MKSSLSDYNDTFILLKGNIRIAGNIAARVAFKKCAPFSKCITKFDGTTVDDTEDLDLVIPMYNLLECSLNYCDTAGSLGFCSKNEATNFNNAIADNNDFKSFRYKTKLIKSTAAANGILKKVKWTKHDVLASIKMLFLLLKTQNFMFL